MKRKYLVIILAVVILLGTNATFASEHGNETLTLHESALEQSVEETQTDVLSNENDVGSLKDIKDLISKTPSGGEIKLNKSYVYNPTTDNDNNQIYASVVINKAVTIDGGGNTISGDNKFKIFTVSSSGVTLKNIKFINAFTEGNGGALDVGYGSHNLKLINCSFENCKAAVYGGAITIKQANNVEIIDCDFISNIGDPDRVSRGGAINWEFCDGGTLTGCNFIDNSAHYGGAVYSYSSSNIKIYNNHFENNSAGSYAADIWSDDNYATLHDCDFINSKAKLYGGSIYWKGSNSYIYSLNFTNVTAQQGGAFYLINGANVTIAKSNFKQSKATNNGGAIYAVSSTHITDCNFTDGEAGSAGGVYISGKGCSIKKSTFTNNHATNENGGCVFVYGDNCVIDETSFDTSSTMNPNKSGGIIYWSGANGVLTNSELKRGSSKYGGAVYLNGANAELSDNDFIDNFASNYGGAIYSNSKLTKINKAYFIGNNATAGSAIFKTTVVNYLTDMTFVHNQAHSRDITITNEGKRFTATYRAYDNILNAIWNNGAVTSIFIDGVNPVKGVENSNNGELLYQDDREYDQTIVVSVLDNDNNVVESETLKTGLYGEVNFTAKKGVKIVFAHPEDVFYKGISNDAPIPDFSVEKIALTPQVFQDSDIKFEITVKNTGKVDLTGIVITEDDFKGLTYVSYHESPLWTYSNVGGKPTWKLNSKLVPEEVATLIVTFKAHDVGTYNNTVVVTCDGDITESANASVTIIPDTFEAMKLSLIPITKLGDQTIFEIVVHNTGELDIHNVFVIEDSFDGLIFDRTIRDDLWDYEIVDGRHKWTLKESLAGHEYAGIFVIFNTTATGNFTNYAIVGHEGQNKTVNATVEVNETVHAPDVINAKMNISIETIHPLVVVGDQTMFEIVVHNTGNVPLTQVTVEEFEYNGLIFHDFKVENELWDYIPKTLTQATRVGLLGAPVENDHTWIINTPLLVNEYLGFFVIFNSTATGRYTNTVHGSSDQTPDKLPASDDVHVIDTAYTIEKVAVTPEANVGDEVTFQIIVKNIGEVDITELAISENPDDGLEFVRDEGTEDMWSRDGMTWYLSNTLVSGETLQFFVVFKATKAGNLTNTIVSDDKTSNATVCVSEKVPVENQTNPDENETAPEDEGDSDGGEIIPSGEFYAQGSATTQDSTVAVNADVNSKATGNPIFALLAVLLSLVVLRRRN